VGQNLRTGLAFLTEANARIGTGHLVETLKIAGGIGGPNTTIVVPRGAPEKLLAEAGIPVKLISDFSPSTLEMLARELGRNGTKWVVTNLRRVNNPQIHSLTTGGLGVICIDELGGRQLDCARVINPSPVEEYHRYTSKYPGFRLYDGPAYMPLSPEYAQWNSSPRSYEGPVRCLVVAMGGVDRTGATLRILNALRGWRPDIQRHVVLGAGFAWANELETLLKEAGEAWTLHHNLPGLAELLGRADAGFTAGGNTLFEMACVGTPALVLHEDPHEAAHGKIFSQAGFAHWLGNGQEFSAQTLKNALESLDDPRLRRRCGETGRKLVDGKGLERISRIIQETISVDSAIATSS